MTRASWLTLAVTVLTGTATAPAVASTRPVTCPAISVRMSEPPRPTYELRVTTWQTARDVHDNASCRRVNCTARLVFTDLTGESERYGWMFWKRRGHSDTYYGGHGGFYRITWRET